MTTCMRIEPRAAMGPSHPHASGRSRTAQSAAAVPPQPAREASAPDKRISRPSVYARGWIRHRCPRVTPPFKHAQAVGRRRGVTRRPSRSRSGSKRIAYGGYATRTPAPSPPQSAARRRPGVSGRSLISPRLFAERYGLRERIAHCTPRPSGTARARGCCCDLLLLLPVQQGRGVVYMPWWGAEPACLPWRLASVTVDRHVVAV